MIHLFYGKSQIYGIPEFPVNMNMSIWTHRDKQGMFYSKSDGVPAHRGKVAINPDLLRYLQLIAASKGKINFLQWCLPVYKNKT